MFYPLSSQTIRNIHPVWERSNGNHDHTSRDELHLSTKDYEDNIILASSVERDSTFADLLVQKFSDSGTLIWEIRHTSGLGLDYDRPVKMIISPDNEIYLLCSAVYFTGSGIGFILKINKNGTIAWRKDMAMETVEHEHHSFFDGYLDAENTLMVTYTCRADALFPAPTYFMTINKDGTVIKKFETTGIGQPSTGIAYGMNEFHDKSGNFVFILRDNEIYKKLYLRKINPVTGLDTTITVSDKKISPDENIYLQYIEWEFVRVSENGDIFAATNFNPFKPIDRYFLLRMNSEGVIQYIISSKDIVNEADFQDFFPRDSSVVITGLTNGNQPQTYLWHINSQGNIVEDAVLQQNGNLIPQRLIRGDTTFFIHAISLLGNDAYVFNSKYGFDIIWTHRLSTPSTYGLAGSNVIVTEANQIAACGTLRAKKHANSIFYSEEDIFLEQFTPNNPGYNWQYIHSDQGTSYVTTVRHAFGINGEITLITEEKTGPEPAFVVGSIVAPSRFYAYRYDANGNLIWSVEIPHTVNMSFFYEIARDDKFGNIYLPGYGDVNSNLLIKINHGGASVKALQIPGGILRILTLNDGKIAVLSGGANGGTNLNITDSSLTTVQVFALKGIADRIFQLPGSGDVFVYTVNNDSATWQISPRACLYKNGVLEWEYALPHPTPQTEQIADLDFDPVTGRVYMSSYSSSFGSSRLHRIDLDGSNPATSSFSSQYGGDIFCQNNGNFYIYTPYKLVLYNPAFSPVGEHTLPSAGYVFSTVGDNLFAFDMGSVSVFDNEGTYKARLFSPDITSFVQQSLVNDSYNLYTSGNFGTAFFTFSGTGGNFGWRWFRGVLKKFEIKPDVLSTHAPHVGLEHVFRVYPNPAKDFFQVLVPDQYRHSPLHVIVYDLYGRAIKTIALAEAPPIISIDSGLFLPGQYFIQCLTGEGRLSMVLQKI